MPVNNAIYDHYGERWYDAQDDPVALLRAETKTKLPWILEKIKRHNIGTDAQILDVGCGAGFLSNALALKGFHVYGVDVSNNSLKVAQRHDQTGTVQYLSADAYQLPFKDKTFSIVTAMDFLEHVESPEKVIHEIGRVLKPKGLFFYHTFNRNWVAHVTVIKMVEYLVKNTPKDMHVIDLFLKPSEVENFCQQAGLKPIETVGIRPVFSSIPLKNYFTGVVPKSMRFKVTKSSLLSYLGYAQAVPRA